MLKKILFLFVFMIIFSRYSYAAPAYGTHMPEERRWICGFEGDFLIDRNLDNDQGGTNGNRYFFNLSCGILPWISLDGKIGVGNVDWDRTGGNDDINYSTNFAGGYGFRIKVYEIEKWGIKGVAGFQHISVHPEAKNQNSEKNEVIIDDWQGSVIVSKDAGRCVPYTGIRYGSVDFIKWVNEKDRKRIKSEDMFGLIIGLDYRLDERTKVNIEGTFVDGEEVAIGISRDF